ncbi:delta-60 repeat domain-containing protein [Streptomyces sp. NPDC056485]|uniref:delta-60 repeat domain-containing protein n=1 Tax=Streptomyces sp. NPDC056485 TaxID=3345834 RepID=UPI00367CE68B
MSAAGGEDENIWRIALQRDGKIVAVGHAITATGGEDFALARYLPDGRLDQSFGTGGKVFTAVARYLPDGRPDPAFGTGGLVVRDVAGGTSSRTWCSTGTGASWRWARPISGPGGAAPASRWPATGRTAGRTRASVRTASW